MSIVGAGLGLGIGAALEAALLDLGWDLDFDWLGCGLEEGREVGARLRSLVSVLVTMAASTSCHRGGLAVGAGLSSASASFGG